MGSRKLRRGGSRNDEAAHIGASITRADKSLLVMSVMRQPPRTTLMSRLLHLVRTEMSSFQALKMGLKCPVVLCSDTLAFFFVCNCTHTSEDLAFLTLLASPWQQSLK